VIAGKQIRRLNISFFYLYMTTYSSNALYLGSPLGYNNKVM